jgi:hypothetical protein
VVKDTKWMARDTKASETVAFFYAIHIALHVPQTALIQIPRSNAQSHPKSDPIRCFPLDFSIHVPKPHSETNGKGEGEGE